MNSVSKDLEQVIIGGLLGDAYLVKNKKYPNSNSSFGISHCPKQLDYLKWKFSFFERENLVRPSGIYSLISNKKYLQYSFQTRALPLFNSYYIEFYNYGKKKVTRHILNKLGPLGLAIWFMDDGSRTIDWCQRKSDGLWSVRRRRLEIATDSFTRDEHDIIKNYFKVVWDINIGIHKSKKSFKTYINATNANKLIEIIRPYIVPCMQYKIDLKYNAAHLEYKEMMTYSELHSDMKSVAEMTTPQIILE